jgi:hypothetical protein
LTNNNNQRWELIDRTAAEETTTPEPTTAEPTTVSDGYTTAASNTWATEGKWGLFYGNWVPAEASYKKGTSPEFSVKAKQNTLGTAWLIQASYTTDVTAGHTYKVTANVTTDKNASIGMKEDLSNGTDNPVYTNTSAGVAKDIVGTYQVSSGQIKVMFELGVGVESGTTVNFNRITIEDVTPPETTTPEPTTAEPTTEEPTTEKEVETIHTVTSGLSLDGYQINPSLNGFRTVYSVEPSIEEKQVREIGLVYALKDYSNPSDLYVRDDHPYVKHFASTTNLPELLQSGSKTTRHSMTMLFAHGNAKEFSTNMSLRAYAKLSDGSYVYTNVYDYTIFRVAEVLYNGNYFGTPEAHNYLYNRILKVVNPQYTENPFDYGSILAH